jgi:dolichol-phosphate mannosyltransferase
MDQHERARSGQPDFSIVIPILNESATLPELLRRLDAVVKQLGHTWEVIVVNDGSTDDSIDVLLSLKKQYAYLKVVDLSRNFGHQPALTAGIEHASGRAVILMDGDLQDQPEAIPAFIEKWREGFAVVYAIREKRKESLPKRAAFAAFYWIQTRISRIETPLNAGIFSLLDRAVVEALKSMPERNRYLPGLRAYVGFPQTGVRVERAHRFEGEPRVRLRGLIKLSMDAIFGYATLPLRLVFLAGLVLAGVSLCVAALGLYFRFVLGVQLADWAFGLTTTFFFGGVQLISIGIIGEYVGRIYDEVKRRPYYVAKRLYGFERNLHEPAGAPVANRVEALEP